MASRSWLGRPGRAPRADEVVRKRLFGAWHVLCITFGPMLHGCYFFLPFVEVTRNVAPTIDFSSPAEGEPLRFQGPQETAFVFAQDEDGDALSFVWTLEGYGIRPEAVPFQSGELQGSQLSLQQDMDFDGRELTVSVYDPAGASARRSWVIEILEATP